MMPGSALTPVPEDLLERQHRWGSLAVKCARICGPEIGPARATFSVSGALRGSLNGVRDH